MLGLFPLLAADEFLFSAVARLGAMFGMGSDFALMQLTMGRTSNCRSIDLPTSLELLVGRLPTGHGLTVRELAESHTTYPYIAQFAPREMVNTLLGKMARPGARVPCRIGIMSHSFLAPTLLRFCEQCADEDMRVLGMPTWHRVHQMPGVLVCPRHGGVLMETPVRRHGGSYGRTFVTLSNAVMAESRRLHMPDLPYGIALRMATGAQTILNRSPGCDIAALAMRLRDLLSAYRWTKAPSLMRTSQLAEDLVAHQTISLLARAAGAVWDVASVGLALNRLLHRNETAEHPLLVQLVVEFVGADLQGMLDISPLNKETERTVVPSHPCANPVCRAYSGDPLAILPKLGLPMGRRRFHCRLCDMAYTYDPAMPSRLAVLSPGGVWEAAMITTLNNDAHISARSLASRLGVSLSTLQRHARRLGVARAAWSCAPKRRPRRQERHEFLRSKHRATWKDGRSNCEPTKAKDLPPALRAAYRWLLAHDPEWLSVNHPLLRPEKRSGRLR